MACVSPGVWHRSATAFQHFASQSLQPSLGCWHVSSHGRVCNSKGVISNGTLRPDGYMAAGVFQQTWLVHRVVKIAFHGLPTIDDAWRVHHIDGDRANNRLENLEYVTHSENMHHSFSSPSRRSSGPAQSKPVLWRPVGSISWRTSPSVTAAAWHLAMHKSTVSACCRKESAAKGYEFRYQDVRELVLPGEEWRPMVDPRSGISVAGRMVSSFGRITSRTGLISRGYQTSSGYFRTALLFNSHCRSSTFVHRLAALAFLGPPPSIYQTFVNHKDLDKGNNAAENLEWVSPGENLAHFHAASTLGRGTTAKPLWSRLHGTDDKWKCHRSMKSAAHELCLDRTCISKCTRGVQRQTGGFEFQLAETPAETSFSLPGEEWRQINKRLLQRDRELRGLC